MKPAKKTSRPPQKHKELTAKERLFVHEYLLDLDHVRAALSAGYSPTTARTKACTWIRPNGEKPLMYAAIEKRLNAADKTYEISREKILREVAKAAFVDIRKAFNDDGTMLNIKQIDDDTAAAIAGVEMDEIVVDRQIVGMTKKVKLSDKKGYLELLMKHKGMLNEKIVHDVTNPLRVLLEGMQASAIKPVQEDPDQQE